MKTLCSNGQRIKKRKLLSYFASPFARFSKHFFKRFGYLTSTPEPDFTWIQALLQRCWHLKQYELQKKRFYKKPQENVVSLVRYAMLRLVNELFRKTLFEILEGEKVVRLCVH